MQQKEFVFKYPYSKILPKHLLLTRPDMLDEIKDELLQSGWLVKDLDVREVLLVTGSMAKANVSKAERLELQKSLDSNAQTEKFYFTAPKC